jgi:hypothetical protein
MEERKRGSKEEGEPREEEARRAHEEAAQGIA